jgi:carbohydrate-selective porin OprB
MKRMHPVAWLGAAALLVLSATPSSAEEPARHSGTVVAVDRAAGTLVVGEVGPWRLVGGETAITKVTVRVSSSTQMMVAERVPDGTEGFPGGFAERPLGARPVREGDFVTVTGVEEGGQLTAAKVVVSIPSE